MYVESSLSRRESAIVRHEAAPRIPRRPRAVFSNIPMILALSAIAWAIIIGVCHLITAYLP